MAAPINKQLEDTIEKIAEESKVMALALTTRDIQVLVKAQLGFEPATSTVARVLRRLGINNDEHPHKWRWGKK